MFSHFSTISESQGKNSLKMVIPEALSEASLLSFPEERIPHCLVRVKLNPWSQVSRGSPENLNSSQKICGSWPTDDSLRYQRKTRPVLSESIQEGKCHEMNSQSPWSKSELCDWPSPWSSWHGPLYLCLSFSHCTLLQLPEPVFLWPLPALAALATGWARWGCFPAGPPATMVSYHFDMKLFKWKSGFTKCRWLIMKTWMMLTRILFNFKSIVYSNSLAKGKNEHKSA